LVAPKGFYKKYADMSGPEVPSVSQRSETPFRRDPQRSAVTSDRFFLVERDGLRVRCSRVKTQQQGSGLALEISCAERAASFD
jgi:hypothetical protein